MILILDTWKEEKKGEESADNKEGMISEQKKILKDQKRKLPQIIIIQEEILTETEEIRIDKEGIPIEEVIAREEKVTEIERREIKMRIEVNVDNTAKEITEEEVMVRKEGSTTEKTENKGNKDKKIDQFNSNKMQQNKKSIDLIADIVYYFLNF